MTKPPSESSAPTRWPPRRRLLALLAVVACVVVVIWLWDREPSAPPVNAMLQEARSAYARGEYARAEQLAKSVLRVEPRSTAALYIAAKSLSEQQKPHEALRFLMRIPADGSARFLDAADSGVKLAMKIGRPREAETLLRGILKYRPASIDANNRLAYLLGVQGRAWEARRYLLNVVRLGRPTVHHLVMLSAGEPVIRDKRLLKRFQEAAPDDPIIRLGPARTLVFEGKLKQGIAELESIVHRDPALIEAQARLGVAYANSGNPGFAAWNRRLPAAAERHPDVWAARGIVAQSRDETAPAARCFLEAVKRDPNHRVACFRLGRLLAKTGDSVAAREFTRRAEQLRKLAGVADKVFSTPKESKLLRDAMRLTESLGRRAEALAWAKAARNSNPAASVWAGEAMARLDAKKNENTDPGSAGGLWQIPVDVAKFPLPKWLSPESEALKNTAGKNAVAAVAAAPATPQIAFTDDAQRAGLVFQYDNGARPNDGGNWIVESMGGGVAVLDFDCDGIPDLFFTQGGGWPPRRRPVPPTDRLFRNTGDGRLIDVTTAARLAGIEYSHGCSVGDLNSDGLPDLYVANAGRNRLLVNNGDGTFSDVTDTAGITGRQWTTSCLLADVSGDGLPDIYDVNYLKVDLDNLDFCPVGSEETRCVPSRFAGEFDRLYLNLGDGRFRDVSKSAGIPRPAGKGLGIVAADLFGSGRIDLFVANDTTPNFLFRREDRRGGLPLRFRETALAAGVAFDGDGLAQACMGIAFGDANGDGRGDLLVTNYARQSNVLYLQTNAGFSDATRAAGLRGPSFAPLGFGTQFLDADLDGRADLVVVNGHVYEQRPDMRPQFFYNLGGGRFKELPADAVGPYFVRKSIGRGLARWDWNRDGKPDFVVSQTNSPAGLLTNRTGNTGHFLSVQLRGTSDRDAIGTTVTIETGGKRFTQQLSAGDGYQASNQRELIFGVGAAKRIDRLTVRWLDGTVSQFRNLLVDRRILIRQYRHGRLELP